MRLKGGPDNMFAVVNKEKTINLIRLTNIGNQLLPREEEKKEPRLTGNQERILIEVLGVDPPNAEYLLSLKHNIEKQI